MLKYILNLKTLLLVAAMVVVVGIIMGQQSLLESKIDEYGDAATQYSNVSEEREALDQEKNSPLDDSDLEDIARGEGYVRDDEIVFDYE